MINKKKLLKGKCNIIYFPGLFARTVFLLIVLSLATGCTEDNLCEDIINNPLRIGFYVTENGEPVPGTLDSLSVIGLERKDSIYANQVNVGQVEIPLDQSRDYCGFLFVFPHHNDTLKIDYERNLSLVSIECGFATFFEINDLKITNNRIQSHIIEEYNVTNVNEEHIRFILHTQPD